MIKSNDQSIPIWLAVGWQLLFGGTVGLGF